MKLSNEIHHKNALTSHLLGKQSKIMEAVMAIYKSVLKQVINFPHLEFIVDKSDNAGCYYNEVLFAWKVN